jgi:hypothetical protein
MGQVLRIPPAERDWTPWERLLLSDTLLALSATGSSVTRYEWLTTNGIWCAFMVSPRKVVAEVGRVGRTYYLRWENDPGGIVTLHLSMALEQLRTGWERHCAEIIQRSVFARGS